MEPKNLFYFFLFLLGVYSLNLVPYCTLDSAIDFSDKSSTNIFLKVVGNSMLPSIKDSSLCVCERSNQYNVGDIVAYHTIIDGETENVIHRVYFIKEGVVLTKGDNNKRLDHSIDVEDIFCKVPIVPRYHLFF